MPLSKNTLALATYGVFILLVLAAPLYFDVFWLNRFSKFLVFGMLGIAMALCWGYAGILNLGQGLFFGLGAYAIAMSMKLASPTSLAQGSDKPIPDFMLWNAEPGAPIDLCCITNGSFLWIPFKTQFFGVVMSIVVPTVVAFLIGSIIFRKRISGVFISIITLAIVLLVRLLVVEAQPFTNGFNGLTDLGYLTVFGHEFDPYFVSTYYLIAISLITVLLATRSLVSTRSGLILQAIRDDDRRARFLGFDVPAYQIFFFCVSAAIAGYAGMLYVVAAEFASPTFMDLAFSIAMVVWAAVGGRNSLLGACIGAILINMIEATVSETPQLVEAWKVVMGLAFVLAVLFLPRGIAGLVSRLGDLLVRKPSPTGQQVDAGETAPARAN
ncbi:urea ABC transporter permease subunit UrtC [Shinella sp.]|uniref:urea ABC transporter permease subunit UrtC n=1 Tax=Shinella sp. TaxID=1870904 RepID=UPI0039E49BF1